MNITISELQDIFQSALDEPVVITEETKRDDVESWDSINHLNLIVELEDKLKISFTKEEIEHLDSVKQLIDIIQSK
jgi:acyl carrier protein